MLATALHVLLFVAGLIGLLAIKKQRLRHIPIRRTHIPRRNAEGTIWLQRFVNALLDMLHSALAEKQAREAVEAAAAQGSVGVSPARPEQVLRASLDIYSSKKLSTPENCDGAVCNDDADSVSSAEVLSELPFLNTLKAQLEEQISALLEDKGIASFADFRVKDWGGKPPVIKALYLSHGGGGGSGSTASSVTGASAPSSAASSAPLSGGVGGRNSLDSMSAGGVAAVAQQRAAAGIPLSSPSGIGKQTQQNLQQQQSQHPQMSSPVSGESFSYTNLMQPLAAATVSAERQGDTNVDALKTNVRTAMDPSMISSLRYRGSGDEFGMASGVGTAVRERSMTGSMAHSARPSGSGGAHGGADLSSPVAGSSSAVTAAGVTSAHTCGARRATDTTRSLSVLDAEVEVEYSGNFSVSLNADLPIARGRYLQVYVSLSDVRMLAAHVRLRLSLEYEPATVESPQPQPYLSGKLWLVSDPMFDAAFHSTLTQYRIRDFFMVPVLVKFFLLRFVRTKLRPFSQMGTSTRSTGSHRRRAGAGASGKMGNAAGGAAPGTGANQSSSNSSGMPDDVNEDAQHGACDASGLSFRVPLPADVVDGGEHWWSSIARSSMSEQAVPFTNAYYVH